MNQHNRIEVVDASGWRKQYPLQKTIVHVGSAPRNDIVLDPVHGGGVASLHVQLISSGNEPGCKLVNLANADILLDNQVLPPRSVIKLSDGAAFKLGSFTLIFRSGERIIGDSAGSSRNIGLSIYMSQMSLAPDQSLWGTVNIHNRGDKSGVQFDVSLDGLDTDCYDIEPGPLLSAGAEKEIQFRLYHRGIKPVAGERTITIRVSAPRAYPTDEATITQTIRVLPCYRHQVRLLTPDAVEAQPPAQTEKDKADAPVTKLETEPSFAQINWGEGFPAGRPKQKSPDRPFQAAAQRPLEAKKPPPAPSTEEETAPLLPETEEPEGEPGGSQPEQAPLPEAPSQGSFDPPPPSEPELSPPPPPAQPLPAAQEPEPPFSETEAVPALSSPTNPVAEAPPSPPPRAKERDEEMVETRGDETPESPENWWAETDENS